MEITFTAKIPDEGVGELLALLTRLWDSPNAVAEVSLKTMDNSKLDQAAAPAQQSAPAAPAPAAPAQPKAAQPAAKPVTAAQIQAAAGTFMDAAPGNLQVLQDILAELGAQSLPQLGPEQLQAFAARLREHGVAV